MENKIKISDDLFGVLVPKDAFGFFIDADLYYKIKTDINNWRNVKEEFETSGNYKIIGLANLPSMEFDFKYGSYDKMMLKTRIEKAIQDAGLYLVNPICNPFYIKQIGENMRTSTYIAGWQFKEEKTIKGNLLLIKKLK